MGFSTLMLVITRLTKRALSSAGLEHLPYKQRVGGSNPSAPTKKEDVQVVHPLFCGLHPTLLTSWWPLRNNGLSAV